MIPHYILPLLLIVLNTALFNNVLGQNILYEDHFDTGDKWTVTTNGVKFKKGKMIVSSDQNYGPVYSPQKTQPKDEFDYYVIDTRYFSGEVTAQWVKDIGVTSNTGFGIEYLPFRLEIKPDGSYKIMTKPLGKEWLLEASSNGKPHPAVKTGQADNKLKLVLNNNVISFYINDQLIKKVNEAYPPSLQHYTTKKYCFKPFINGYQEVMFDDYIIKSTPVFDDLFTESKSAGNDDLSDLFKTPVQQLTQVFTQYGITMKVNPKWTGNKKNVLGSTISLYGDELNKLKLTFPDFVSFPSSIKITLALNPGTIENKKQQIINLIYNEFWKYLNVNGKDLSPDEWKSKWLKTITKSEYFTTAEGMKGEIYAFNYPTVIYNEPGSKTSDVHSAYRVYYMIQQPDDKIIQCTASFEKAKYGVNKPLPEDISAFKGLNPEDEQKCMDFLKAMFKTITAPK